MVCKSGCFPLGGWRKGLDLQFLLSTPKWKSNIRYWIFVLILKWIFHKYLNILNIKYWPLVSDIRIEMFKGSDIHQKYFHLILKQFKQGLETLGALYGAFILKLGDCWVLLGTYGSSMLLQSLFVNHQINLYVRKLGRTLWYKFGPYVLPFIRLYIKYLT